MSIDMGIVRGIVTIGGGILVANAVNTVIRALSYLWLYKREKAAREARTLKNYESILKELELSHMADAVADKKLSVN